MRILFMGTPDFAVPSLAGLAAAGHQLVGVFSQPDKPKNRGMKLQPTPVKVCAQELGVPVYQPTKLRDGTALELIGQLDPELIVVAAYGRILPQEILDYPKYGCINVHSSLLPRYRGAAPIHWAILNGDQETGVTIMHMALALDAGDIIAQRATPIGPEETAPELYARLAELGGEQSPHPQQNQHPAGEPAEILLGAAGEVLSQLAAGQHGQQVAQQRQQKDKDGKPALGRKSAAETRDQSVQAQRDGQTDRLQTGKGVGAVKVRPGGVDADLQKDFEILKAQDEAAFTFAAAAQQALDQAVKQAYPADAAQQHAADEVGGVGADPVPQQPAEQDGNK